MTVPYGFCECGCGRKTNICTHTRTECGNVKGKPNRYLSGHGSTLPRGLSKEIVIEGTACRTIPLTQGKEAIVDVIDYDRLAVYMWFAQKNKHMWYAKRFDFSTGTRILISMHGEIIRVPYHKLPDHKNGNGLDNRRSNLRPATHEQNGYNRCVNKGNTTGFKGISWDKQRNKYRASIKPQGISYSVCLGHRDAAEDAARLYDIAALKLFGEFAKLNFPREDYQCPSS